jgi:hypothetical protein
MQPDDGRANVFNSTGRRDPLEESGKDRSLSRSSSWHNPKLSEALSKINMRDAKLGYYFTGVGKYFKSKDESYFANLYRDHFRHTFISLQFCKNLKPPTKRDLVMRKVNLVRREKDKGKKTLVLD